MDSKTRLPQLGGQSGLQTSEGSLARTFLLLIIKAAVDHKKRPTQMCHLWSRHLGSERESKEAQLILGYTVEFQASLSYMTPCIKGNKREQNQTKDELALDW